MNIRQNKQHQQSNFQNQFKDISSLEALTEYAVTSLTENMPLYFRESEKEFTKELRNYGAKLIQECKSGTLLDLSDDEIEETIEKGISEAMDVSCVLNHEYFKAGIRFGTLLIMQMLL